MRRSRIVCIPAPAMLIPDAFHRVQPGADALREGYFLIRRDRAGRVPLPVRIWFGPPLDEDGTPLDRSPRWQVMIAGEMLHMPGRVAGLTVDSLADIWPGCARWPIDEADYRYRIDLAAWAAENDPDDPHGTATGRIDPMTVPLPF